MERGNETKRRRRHSLASSSPGREALATPATGQDRRCAPYFATITRVLTCALCGCRLSSILSEKKDELFSASENAFLARGLPPGPTSRSFNRSSSFSSIIECPPYLESDDPNGEPLDWRSVLLQLRQDVDGLPIPLSKHHPRVTLGVEPDTDENSDNTNIDGGSATEHDAQAKDSSAIEGADEDRHQNDEEEEDEDRLVPVPPIALPAPPRRSALKKKSRGRYRRTHIRFASEADVYDMDQSYYPNPASPRDYHPESRQVPPPPPTTLQQQYAWRYDYRVVVLTVLVGAIHG